MTTHHREMYSSTVILILLGFTVNGINSQACADINPVLTVPITNYLADNVTLHCAGDAPETVSFLWRMRCASCELPQDVYSANARSAYRSRATPEFAANVTGVFVEGYTYNHSLTILDAGIGFNGSEWMCKISTPTCFLGKNSALKDLELIGPPGTPKPEEETTTPEQGPPTPGQGSPTPKGEPVPGELTKKPTTKEGVMIATTVATQLTSEKQGSRGRDLACQSVIIGSCVVLMYSVL